MKQNVASKWFDEIFDFNSVSLVGREFLIRTIFPIPPLKPLGGLPYKMDGVPL